MLDEKTESEEKRIRAIVILKDRKFQNPIASLDDVIEAGGYREFIDDLVNEGKLTPQSAFSVFSKVFKGLDEVAKLLKQIKVLEPDFYFITPFGVLWEEEPVIPYKETIDDIPLEKLRRIAEVFGVTDRIYSLLESQPDFLVMYVSPRLVKMLDLFSYIPKSTIAVVISDHPMEADAEHVRTLYPSPIYLKMVRLVDPKVSSETFPSAALRFIAKVLYLLYREMGDENFYRFMKSGKGDPEQVLNSILGREATELLSQRRDESLLRFLR